MCVAVKCTYTYHCITNTEYTRAIHKFQSHAIQNTVRTHTLSLPLLLSLSLCVSEVRSFVRFGCCMRLIATLGTGERIEFVFIHLRQNVTHDNIFQPNCVRQLHYIKNWCAHDKRHIHTHICTTEIKRCEGKNDTRWQIDRGERLMQFVW